MSKAETQLPNTLEAAQQEIQHQREQKENKDKKRKWERYALIILLAFVLGLVVGMAMGVNQGYHDALVDFKIIAGAIYPPF